MRLFRRPAARPQNRRVRRSNTSAAIVELLENRLLLSATAARPALDFGTLQVDATSYSASQVLVRFQDGARVPSRFGGTELFTGSNLWAIDVAPGQSVTDAVAMFQGRKNVAFAQPDYTVQALGHVSPNDGLYTSGGLWGLNNGAKDVDIDAPEAWHTTTGSSSVVVAVIDSGIDFTHPDLAGNIWTNPGEIAGNRVDDDGNGYVDDVHGYDFANDDGNPMDDNGHGTHVAGTIGAVGNNSVGGGTDMVGVAWDVSLMGLKFLDAAGYGSTSNAVRALDYAVRMGARISNNSWGGGAFDQALADAVQRAAGADHLFVAAAGNGDRFGRALNNDSTPNYPSNHRPTPDTVISVASTDRDDKFASSSNYGAATVDLAAPGVGIWSTIPFALDTFDYSKDGYARYDGTSMATPHVSGAAALVWSANPGLSAVEVKQILMDTVDPIGDLNPTRPTVTNGRLNAASAVETAAALLAPAGPAITINDVSITEGNSGTSYAVFTVSLSEAASSDVFVNYSTADGTATAASGDYTAQAAQTLVIPAGQTSGTISVAVNGDTAYEPNETFFVNLSGAVNASLADREGQATILNDDDPPAGNANHMYVWDILWGEVRGRSRTDLHVTVDVNRDSNADGLSAASDGAAAGATVQIRIIHDSNGDGVYGNGKDKVWSGSAATLSDGTVKFVIGKAPSGNYRAEVTGLAHSTYTWNETLNRETPDFYRTGVGELSTRSSERGTANNSRPSATLAATAAQDVLLAATTGRSAETHRSNEAAAAAPQSQRAAEQPRWQSGTGHKRDALDALFADGIITRSLLLNGV